MMASRKHIIGYKHFKGLKPPGERGENPKNMSLWRHRDRKKEQIYYPRPLALGKEKSPYLCLGNSNGMFLKTTSNEGNF